MAELFAVKVVEINLKKLVMSRSFVVMFYARHWATLVGKLVH